MTTSHHAQNDSVRHPKASALALQGDTLRLAGNYAKATVIFTKALRANDLSDSLRPWVHAHLGASWLGLGNLELSVKHLHKALEQRPDYSWARAHKGEAWRQYTRNNIVSLKEKNILWACVCQAIVDLEAAARACPSSPWIMAHCGAAWGLAFYVAKNLPEVIVIDADPGNVFGDLKPEVPSEQVIALRRKASNPDSLAEEAQRYLNIAIGMSPSYAWALAFQAFVLVLRSSSGDAQYYDEALMNLGRAQLSDTNKNILVKTGYFKILNYLGRYDASVETAFQAQADDPLNLFAPYFIASGLHMMAVKHVAEGSADADTWRQVAQSSAHAALHALTTTQALVDAMKAGLLHMVDGPREKCRHLVHEASMSFDPEAYVLLQRDATLSMMWHQAKLDQKNGSASHYDTSGDDKHAAE